MIVLIDFAREIKERLTTLQVVEHYGFTPDYRGFICCPFHEEKSPSMKVYDGDKGFYCFGCHESGDLLSFVQKYFGLDFKGTIAKLNDDFYLGLPISGGMSLRQKYEFQAADLARRAALEQKKSEENAVKSRYYEVLAEYRRLEEQAEQYCPKSLDEDFHPLFIEAMQKKGLVAELLDIAETRLTAYGLSK